jgi:hypothetical protein
MRTGHRWLHPNRTEAARLWVLPDDLVGAAGR